MKRGSSGLSFALVVDKPSGVTSHDVVNKVRKLTSERRVGHAGTLDPLATGVLPILIGPATRLNQYISSDNKTYIARIVFGISTTTDDAEGEPLHISRVSDVVLDMSYAQTICNSFLGKCKQMPPVYSAIKMNGKTAYKEARAGNTLNLEPRSVEVFKADVIEIGMLEDGYAQGRPFWDVVFCVSKGTYIRALARDIGKKADTHAHIGALRREAVGDIGIEDCINVFEPISSVESFAVDPIRLLDFKIVFPNDSAKRKVENGGFLQLDEIAVFEKCMAGRSFCECTPSIMPTESKIIDGEHVSVVINNKLKAIYRYEESKDVLKPECIFQIGVSRGAYIECA